MTKKWAKSQWHGPFKQQGGEDISLSYTPVVVEKFASLIAALYAGVFGSRVLLIDRNLHPPYKKSVKKANHHVI